MTFTEPNVWAMQYIEILNKRQSTDPEEATFYNTYGFDKLTKPSSTDAPYINARWNTLVSRFNNRYDYRRVGQETMQRWQRRLQNRFDEVVDEMERAYKLYATTTAIDDVVAGTKTTYASGYSNGSTSSGSSTATGKSINTPDSAVNEDDDYADALTKDTSSNSSTSSSNNSHTGNDRTEVLGPDVLAGVNRSIDDWEDLDTKFIKFFENNFLNIW